MPKFFFPLEAMEGSRIHISGETAHHLLHVLRMKPGDEVVLCDGLGTDYHGALAETTPTVIFDIRETSTCDTEPSVNITLFQSLPKGDKMDFIIQKCVELGVSSIQPVHTERCVARIKDKDAPKKIARFQKIAESAAGQSMRGIIPVVHPPLSFKAAIDSISNATTKQDSLTLVAYEKEHFLALKSAVVNNPININLWIGSEGGFSDNEITALCNIGATPITLGRRILRTETAAIATIAQIICLCE